MSLAYPAGGAAAALGVVGLCEICPLDYLGDTVADSNLQTYCSMEKERHLMYSSRNLILTKATKLTDAP